MVEKKGALQGGAPEMVGDAPLMRKCLAAVLNLHCTVDHPEPCNLPSPVRVGIIVEAAPKEDNMNMSLFLATH